MLNYQARKKLNCQDKTIITLPLLSYKARVPV